MREKGFQVFFEIFADVGKLLQKALCTVGSRGERKYNKAIMLLRFQGGAIDAFAALSPERGYIYNV